MKDMSFSVPRRKSP